MNWYRVTLTDNWCKPSRWHGYVRAEGHHRVGEIAVGNCPDRAMCKVSSVTGPLGLSDTEIMERLTNTTGPNTAILDDGTLWRRSEILA